MAKSSEQVRKTPLELLSPAGNLATGLAALAAGADAVYIGAPRFGARAAVGVSLEDIATLVESAHLWGAKVYVALNTILYDNELSEAEQIAKALYRIGVDALIIQDFALLALDLPPIALHASTQCHNHDIASLQRLEALGFEQAVLARELTIEDTNAIAQHLSHLRLETFVHGSLCVSYSGRCYLSQSFKERSANRGECAQLCRLPYRLQDADGKVICDNQYLLSLKDLNRSAILQDLIHAGVSSFKIEGRLKSSAYVTNVTAYYRQLLDSFLNVESSHYRRASLGEHRFRFRPNPFKSFSRGATSYQLRKGDSLKESLIRPLSPKSEGEALCRVKACKGKRVILEKPVGLSNGDGICFYTAEGKMEGGRVNRVYAEREFAFLGKVLPSPGTLLFRNYDITFEKDLANPHACERSLPITLLLEATNSLLCLTLTSVEDQTIATKVSMSVQLEKARNPLLENRIAESLQKVGDSIFEVQDCKLRLGGYFVPLSLVGDLRRKAIVALERALRLRHRPKPIYRMPLSSFPESLAFPAHLTFEQNVSNHKASEVYRLLGAKSIDPALELREKGEEVLMTTKHCLRRELGYCTQSGKVFPYREPLYLSTGNMVARIKFDCRDCQMLLFRVAPPFDKH